MEFVVIGDIMVDTTVYGEVTKISPEAPVPVLCRKHKTHTLGGSANVAKNLAAMGHKVIMGGYSGPKSRELFKQIPNINYNYTVVRRKDNIKLRYVDIKTGYHLVRIDDEDEHITYGSLHAGPWEFLNPPKERFKPNGIIISDYCKGAFDSNVITIIKAANDANIPIFVDTRRSNLDIFKGVTWMMPNAQERENIMKEHGFKYIIDIVDHLGLDGLVTTKSEDGMELLMAGTTTPDKGGLYNVKAANEDVVDVTGAGDTAMAAFASAICSGESPKDAMKFANYCAGIVCKRRGTVTIDKDQVEEYYGK